jgi:predicted 2-oxoglutarate/Fe(II)-dependent dioxygenase YbiX
MKFEWYFYKQFFTNEQCIELSQLVNSMQSYGFDRPADNVVKTSTVKVIKWADIKPYLNNLEVLAQRVNQEIFGLDIYQLNDLDGVNYNSYASNNSRYEWHKDFLLNEIHDLKLTVIANISSASYTGGEFEIFLNGPNHIKELDIPGSILIFPSIFSHRVLPVRSGNRETISIWIKGPNLR